MKNDSHAVTVSHPAAQPAPDVLAARSLDVLAAYERAREASSAAAAALMATLTDEQARLYREAEECFNEARSAEADVRLAELLRHVPGLAPCLGVLHEEHLISQPLAEVGRCCTG